MRRILACTLTIALLMSTGAFAYNRTKYKKTSKRYWMKAIGKDKNPNGSEDAYASARLDIDYPGEDGKDHNRIDLFGYASVWAMGSGGFYRIEATAYMVHNAKSKKWWWFIYKGIDADVRVKYHTDLSDAYAVEYFGMVSAKAHLSNSKNQAFNAEAKNFKHGDPTEWVCLDENGKKNHGPDDTCNICNTEGRY